MIRIFEMGPRDGLQNEPKTLSVQKRVELIESLVHAGERNIEIGAFVREDKIPQMSDSQLVVKEILKKFNKKNYNFSVLVPNERGLKEALETGIKEVAVFTAASDSFNKANINCTIEESFERFTPIFNLAKKNKVKVRGYVSTAFYCPYEGKIKATKAVKVIEKLIHMGCYEVSVGDTIGHATPGEVLELLKLIRKKKIPMSKIAMHFHDTRRTALANILESFKFGIRTFDASVGGIGGCPYAPGARGNVATEDVVYMFDGMKQKTSISLEKILKIKSWLSHTLN